MDDKPNTPVDCDSSQLIFAGFGAAYLSKDGKVVWQEDREMEEKDLLSFEEAGRMADRDPGDWTITIVRALSEAYYRRVEGEWVCYKTGQGFA